MPHDAAKQKRWRDSHQASGLCTRCNNPPLPGIKLCGFHRDYAAKSNAKTPECRRRQYRKTGRLRLRDEVFAHYGRACACCQESHPEFLTIDHIDGGGADQRRDGLESASLMRWLKRNRFPSGFRVLCANCNLAMGVYGVCPHGTLPPQATNHPANPYRKTKPM